MFARREPHTQVNNTDHAHTVQTGIHNTSFQVWNRIQQVIRSYKSGNKLPTHRGNYINRKSGYSYNRIKLSGIRLI